MKADPATSDPELDRDLRALFAGVAQPVAPASLSTTVEELPKRGRAGLGGGLCLLYTSPSPRDCS